MDVRYDIETSAWDGFAASHAHGHVLQTSRWAALKAHVGWQVERVALTHDGVIVAGAQMLLRPTPWGQPFAYAPKGPLVDWTQPALVAALLDAMTQRARQRRCYLLKLEPDLPDGPLLERSLAAGGFARSTETVQPRSTVHIDLTASPAEILARMKQKWRYNIRLAARKGVTVRMGGRDDLPAFQRLIEMTAARDQFGVHSQAYYSAAFDLFAPTGQAIWLLAEHQGELLAGIVVFALGRSAWYLWGASSDQQRNLMPNHALQWAAVEWARARGCAIYDLWGIPDEVGAGLAQGSDVEVSASGAPDAPHAAGVSDEREGQGGLWGVWRFKQGFGGQVVRYTGAWDHVLSRPGHLLYRLAQRVRQRNAVRRSQS